MKNPISFVISFFVTIYIFSFLFLSNCSGIERYSVITGHTVWRDYSRNRNIPVKFFFPVVSESERVRGDDSGFPVILFSHGLGGTYDRCSYLSRTWSSFGFIVISVQHPGSDEQVWRGKIRVIKELRDSYEQNWNCRTRAEDLRFVLNSFSRLVESGKLGRLKANVENVGVSGYDIGSLGPLLLSGQIPPDRGNSLRDERVKAVVAMSPPVRNPGLDNNEVYANIQIPALFITGTKDDGIIGVTKAHQRRIPFDYMTYANRYLVIFNNGDHQIYAGALFSISNFFRRDRDSVYQSAITRVSSYFWLAHLANENQAKEIMNSNRINLMLGNLATMEKYVVPKNKKNLSTTTSTTPTKTIPSNYYKRIL
jgi:predicted dienelactone hydrolase